MIIDSDLNLLALPFVQQRSRENYSMNILIGLKEIHSMNQIKFWFSHLRNLINIEKRKTLKKIIQKQTTGRNRTQSLSVSIILACEGHAPLWLALIFLGVKIDGLETRWYGMWWLKTIGTISNILRTPIAFLVRVGYILFHPVPFFVVVKIGG